MDRPPPLPIDDQPKIATLARTGRLVLIGSICLYLFIHYQSESPLKFFILGLGSVASLVLFVRASVEAGDFRWLWQIPVIALAVVALTNLISIYKAYEHRLPHTLTNPELLTGAASLLVAVAAIIAMRRFGRLH